MANWTRYILIAAIAAHMCIANAQDGSAVIPQVILDADNIVVKEDENVVIAEGNVEAEYEGRILRADRLVYDRNTDKVRATGGVVIIDTDGSQRFAEEIETDSNLSDGYAIGFSMRMPTGGVAAAESAIKTKEGYNALDKIVYTACEVCEGDKNPTWALRARRAVLDEDQQMISYSDAVLEIGGVPVIYLPYFAHPDPNSKRRSGLLIPDVGVSSKLGVFYQQPYYWAISPFQDLTISPQITENVNPLLELEYRKRFWSGKVKFHGSFTKEKDFDSDGEKFGESEWRSHLFGDGEFNITNNWQWGFGTEYMSDDLYTRRYDIDGENDERGLYAGQPRRLLNQLYTRGQDTNWYADAALLDFRGLRNNDVDDTFPRALPLFYAERLFDFGSNGVVALNGSTAILNRDIGTDSFRTSVGADWDATRILPGGFVFNPFAEARADYYDLTDSPTGVSKVDRSVATAGARLSYPLFRPGRNVDLLIEPTGMIAYGTPGANNPDIPVEDSLFYEFDESSLFDANAFGGYDLYEGGSKASLGVSATARWKNGVEITAIGGRRWRDEADDNFSVASNLDGTVADWVTGLTADFGDPLRIDARLRLDDDSLGMNRVDVKLSSSWWRLEGTARYYKISGDITTSGNDDEAVQLSTQLRVTDQFFVTYGRMRDISGRTNASGLQGEPRNLRESIGVAYEDDCSRFELAYETSDSVDRTLGPTESIVFRFSLKTLGQFGSADTD